MYGPIGTINSRRGCLNLILGVHVPAGTVDQAKINTLKPSMVNAWCTDPTQRQVLNQVNIQYTYFGGFTAYKTRARRCVWPPEPHAHAVRYSRPPSFAAVPAGRV